MCNRCQFVCVEFSACRTLLLIASLKELCLALPVFIIYTFQAFFGLSISTVMHVVHSPKRGIRACSPGKIQIFWEFEMHWHSGRMFHVQCRQFFGPSLTLYPALVLAAFLPPHYFINIL